MPRHFDLTGRRFGRLTVLRLSDKKIINYRLYWTCQCDCGNVTDILAANLNNGRAKGCGCQRGKVETANTRWITAFGQTKTLTEWARERGIQISTLRTRIDRHKMSPERALMSKAEIAQMIDNGLRNHSIPSGVDMTSGHSP